MKRVPLLSTIIPIYNGEEHLEDLASCIAAQQLSDMELILVDDGSSDQTFSLCRDLEKRYAWIRAVHTANRGVSHARNTGLNLARGQWIHFMDVDDRIEDGMYSEFSETAEKTAVDVIICGCVRTRMENGDSAACGPEVTKNLNKKEVLELFDHMEMTERYWLLDYIWNKWYRRDLIEKYRIRFSESLSLGEDFVFNTQYFQHVTGISLISVHYYRYLIRENGLVSRFREQPWKEREELYKAQVSLYRSLGLFDSNERNLQLQAGQISFGDIRTINSRRCRYKWKEKLVFVHNMIKSSQYIWIMKYLEDRGKNSAVFRIYYYLFLTRCAGLITSVIGLEKIAGRLQSKK